MSTALIYRSSLAYESVMRLLYGRHFGSRYRAVADRIPAGATVVDVCCGPPLLYRRYLRAKGVDYLGIDLNPRPARALAAAGARGMVCDVGRLQELPAAEIVLMQASLYHFLPEPQPLIDKMVAAATRRVIIAEPIRNLSDSRNRLVAWSARRLTNPGDGAPERRFTESTLDQLFAQYGSRVLESLVIPGGREKIYVIEK